MTDGECTARREIEVDFSLASFFTIIHLYAYCATEKINVIDRTSCDWCGKCEENN